MQQAVAQLKVNLPDDVKTWLMSEARRNLRSQGSEIVLAIREKMSRQQENEKADAQRA